MILYIPSPDFVECATQLDALRLANQGRDLLWMVRRLTNFFKKDKGNSKYFTDFWKGYELQLARYGLAIAEERLYRRNISSDDLKLAMLKRREAVRLWSGVIEFLEDRDFPDDMPPLIGDEEFHSNMRALLLHRDAEFCTFINWMNKEYPAHAVTRDLVPYVALWTTDMYESIWKYFGRPEPRWYSRFGWTEEPRVDTVFYDEQHTPYIDVRQEIRAAQYDRSYEAEDYPADYMPPASAGYDDFAAFTYD